MPGRSPGPQDGGRHEAGAAGSEGIAHRPDIFARFLVAHPLSVRIVSYGIVAAAIAVGTFMWVTGRLEPRDAGYTGSFIINLVGSGAIVIPVPGVAAVCFNATPNFGLSPVWLGMLGGAGAGLGEVTGYLVGFGGHTALARFRYYPRIHGWVQRRGGVALFILAIIPNPLFDLGGIAAGALGYPILKFLIYVTAGKVVRFVGVAYACHQGIGWIQRIT